MKTKGETITEIIALLEIRQLDELNALKHQFYCTYESLKPINLIKSTLQEAAGSTEIKNNLLRSALGLITGRIFKMALFDRSKSKTKRIFGSILEFAITSVFAHGNTPKTKN